MNKYISDWWVYNLRKLPWEWIVNVLIKTFFLVPWFSNFNFLQDYFFIIITNLSRVLPAVIQPSGEREICHLCFLSLPCISLLSSEETVAHRKFLQFSWAQREAAEETSSVSLNLYLKLLILWVPFHSWDRESLHSNTEERAVQAGPIVSRRNGKPPECRETAGLPWDIESWTCHGGTFLCRYFPSHMWVSPEDWGTGHWL